MISAFPDQTEELTAEALIDLEIPSDVRISPDGTQAVYTVRPFGKKDKHSVSSLWIAQIHQKHSARQLTSGLFNDTQPQWCPDGESITFVSDRAKHGESSALYILSLKAGEAYPITKSGNKKGISSFKWSPNGRFIAFLSPDELTPEQERKEKEKDDAKVYGEEWEFNRLRCIHVSTRQVSVLYAKESHVNELAWSEDSKEIAYILHDTPEIESPLYKGIKFERVSVSTKESSHIRNFSGPVEKFVWSKENLFFLAGVSPKSTTTSSILYTLSLEEKKIVDRQYGVNNCAVDLKWAGRGYAVLVQEGLRDMININSTSQSTLAHETLYRDIQMTSTWDVVELQDGNQVVALGRSFGHSPTEIYSVLNDGLCQLSQHGHSAINFRVGKAVPVTSTAEDGAPIDGVLVTPLGIQSPKSLPTVVLVHGGPYSRASLSFDAGSYYLWTPLLVSAGYAVLAPNYRGGSSHGEKHAAAARGGMGTTDYSDIITLLKQCIHKGKIDPERVAIGGWSQGGFLSYLSTTRSDMFPFRAAICGAGVSDWDLMCCTSDLPFFEAELTGKAPWEVNDVTSTEGRKGSALWRMKDVDVKMPVLLLHGDEDERVPVSQAVAFARGCRHRGVGCEMVTYPREGHLIEERGHLVDMLKRVRRFYDVHLMG